MKSRHVIFQRGAIWKLLSADVTLEVLLHVVFACHVSSQVHLPRLVSAAEGTREPVEAAGDGLQVLAQTRPAALVISPIPAPVVAARDVRWRVSCVDGSIRGTCVTRQSSNVRTLQVGKKTSYEVSGNFTVLSRNTISQFSNISCMQIHGSNNYWFQILMLDVRWYFCSTVNVQRCSTALFRAIFKH